MYEESIRVPMIVYDPRLPQGLRGRRRDDMVLSLDCAPTMLAMAGLSIPPTMQGQDLTPLIEGERIPWRKDWFYEHTYTLKPPRSIPKSQGVRTGRWKYVRYIDQDPDFEQLFDLENDPLETTNVARDPEYASTLEQLRGRREDWLRDLPAANPAPDE